MRARIIGLAAVLAAAIAIPVAAHSAPADVTTITWNSTVHTTIKSGPVTLHATVANPNGTHPRGKVAAYYNGAEALSGVTYDPSSGHITIPAVSSTCPVSYYLQFVSAEAEVIANSDLYTLAAATGACGIGGRFINTAWKVSDNSLSLYGQLIASSPVPVDGKVSVYDATNHANCSPKPQPMFAAPATKPIATARLSDARDGFFSLRLPGRWAPYGQVPGCSGWVYLRWTPDHSGFSAAQFWNPPLPIPSAEVDVDFQGPGYPPHLTRPRAQIYFFGFESPNYPLAQGRINVSVQAGSETINLGSYKVWNSEQLWLHYWRPPHRLLKQRVVFKVHFQPTFLSDTARPITVTAVTRLLDVRHE